MSQHDSSEQANPDEANPDEANPEQANPERAEPAHGKNPKIIVTVVLVERTLVTTIVSAVSTGGKSNADLADRVRTYLGPIVRDLDLPRIHVMAEGRRVLLHGDVANDTDASAIERIVRGFEDVESVESHLHVGLLPGDNRPSEAEPPRSTMMEALLETAELIGITPGGPAHSAVWGTLSAILEQIPPDERRHVFAHFPSDVVVFVKPRQQFGDENIHWKTELALDVAASLRGGIDLPTAEVLVPLVIGVLRRFVPEEDHDVQRSLKAALRDLWKASTGV